MTPERIEEARLDAKEESESIYGNCSANITNIELLELLATLAESQRTIEDLRLKIENALYWTWNCGEPNMLEVIAALRRETQP